jgi:ATP synthase protein I
LADDRTSEEPGEDRALDARIAAAKAANVRPSAADGNAEGRGWAIGIEFVGTVLVSALIGWLVDRYAGLGTAPWAMIVMLLLGFAAGTRRAMQTSKQFDADPES